jgi:hypothetical protein
LIKNSERWDVNQFAVENRAGDRVMLIEDEDRPATAFSLDTWHPLPAREVLCGEGVVLVVTYTGSNEQGEHFEATVFGWEGCPPALMAPTDPHEEASTSERVSERAESEVRHKSSSSATWIFGERDGRRRRVPEKNATTIELPLIIKSPALFVDRLTIMDAKDWVVHDIVVRGKTIFVQAGDLPGEMFLDSARVILEPLAADDRVEIVATYVGSNTSARLVVELSGTTTPPSVPRAASYFLPMSTGVPILPTQSAQITGRPQHDFLPERMVIADQDDWIVNNIMVGVHCQLAASGDLPGQSFSSRTVGGHVTLDPVRKWQDFAIVTTRGEDCKESAGFFCGVQGRLIH